MFKPQEMCKTIIAGSKEHLDATIEALYGHNALHITDFTAEDEDFKIGRPRSDATGLSEKAIRLRSLASYLNIKGKEDIDKKYEVATIESTVDERLERLDFEVSAVTAELNETDSKIKELNDKEKSLEPLKDFDIPVELYGGYRSLATFVGLVDDIPPLQGVISDYLLESAPHGKGHVIALFVPKEAAEDAFKQLQAVNFKELPLGDMAGLPRDILTSIDDERNVLTADKEQQEARLAEIKQEYLGYILASDEYLTMQTQKAEAPLRFATSKNAFIAEGWIPTERFDQISKTIQDATDGHVIVEVDDSEPIKPEHVPVALENPLPARPYEVLLKAFARPKYNEFDPTMILFITYPIFFGLMLGDVGYGLIAIALGLGVRWKLKSSGIRSLADILIYSGIVTMIFGFAYNEFFGFEIFGHRGFLTFLELPALSRLRDVAILLIITLLIGVAHLTSGYLLGFKNVYSQRGLKKAVIEKLSWILILIPGVIAVALILPSLTSGAGIQLSIGLIASLAVVLVGIVLLLIGEGIIVILELPTLLSNVLSYSRLLAIGLSSAGIALAVNTLAVNLFISKGGFLILIGAIVLIGGHLINLALGILDPGLQSLRLQYVEFFTKFYQGGGIKYNPFGHIKKYTEET
ncbi:MAG: V-type ATP synthase subunit I [Halobacteriota archaeon]